MVESSVTQTRLLGYSCIYLLNWYPFLFCSAESNLLLLKVTKNKQWKDVAAVMGIGASSSGSYTLRKHYMKHILAYECKFDRGGVDPQPIVNQIEAAAKKKTTKTISVPSPGQLGSIY